MQQKSIHKIILKKLILLSNLQITLKGHCEKGWSSKRRAISALKTSIKEVFEIFSEMTGPRRILVSIDRVNKALQKETVSVEKASRMIKGLSETIQEIRDEGLTQQWNTQQ